jgi:predicted nucleic acid-binding protein
MIFIDSDILSYYFSGNTKIRDKIMGTLRSKEQIALTIINVYMEN